MNTKFLKNKTELFHEIRKLLFDDCELPWYEENCGIRVKCAIDMYTSNTQQELYSLSL